MTLQTTFNIGDVFNSGLTKIVILSIGGHDCWIGTMNNDVALRYETSSLKSKAELNKLVESGKFVFEQNLFEKPSGVTTSLTKKEIENLAFTAMQSAMEAKTVCGSVEAILHIQSQIHDLNISKELKLEVLKIAMKTMATLNAMYGIFSVGL